MLKAGAVTLNGPLHITLEDGYVPSIGTEFPIVQGTSVSGKFSSVDLPSGLSVEYRGNTAVIVVTGQVLTGQSIQPFGGLSIALSTPGLVSLEWPASTAGTIESTPALRPDSIWKPVTNFTEKGTGGISRNNLPFTNKALFFRLRPSVR